MILTKELNNLVASLNSLVKQGTEMMKEESKKIEHKSEDYRNRNEVDLLVEQLDNARSTLRLLKERDLDDDDNYIPYTDLQKKLIEGQRKIILSIQSKILDAMK